jgi:hypothetical protein
VVPACFVPVAECSELAPWAGFEPATIRLTVECSTAELPGNRAFACAEPIDCVFLLAKPHLVSGPRRDGKLEATEGIEPPYADLQSAA